MKKDTFNRLTSLRLENDEHKMKLDEMRPRFEALKTRHEDGTAPKAIAAFNLFQTPEELAERMASMIPKDAKRILEPSAGLGRLYKAARLELPRAIFTLVDSSPDCMAELYKLTQDDDKARLWQGDFLSREPSDHTRFDAIVMNPPFKMRRDIKHIMHAMAFLKPGGTLIGLCLSGRIREEKLMPLCDTWEVIPAGTFKQEGTGVETVLFTITK